MSAADPPRAVHLVVDEEERGRRLDNFLLARLRPLPRARVYRLIRSGEIRVNGRRAQAATRLQAGDDIRIPPVRGAAGSRPSGSVQAGRLDWIRSLVRYQDEDLLVLCKPPGLAVHGGSGVSLGAIELLRLASDTPDGLELVHRLDRDTSGCLLVARRRSSLRRLHEQFREGSVRKRYLALLLGGDWPEAERSCSEPLHTGLRRGGERYVQVAPEGKQALTRFRALRRYAGATLVEVDLRTGRTHQIRVHAAALGHPVAGDARYGWEDDPVIAHAGLRRLFLHAVSVEFAHPRHGERLRVCCPLPADLRKVLQNLDD